MAWTRDEIAPTAPETKISQISAFVYAQKTGSIWAAAHRLKLSPAATGHRIQNLEAAFKTPLVVRTPKSTRSIELTEAGRKFYPYALAILKAFEDAKTSLAEGRRQAANPPGETRSEGNNLCPSKPLKREV